MLVAYSVLLLLFTVPLVGGRLSRLGDVELRRVPLVLGALGAQIVVVSVIPGSLEGIHAPVHLATYAMLAAFVWSNRRVPGLLIMAAGAAANLAAIAANDGVMPASASALEQAGMPADKGAEYANSAVVDGAHLSWLGDVFAIPASWPASNVFSIGDALIVLGFAVSVHVLCASAPGRAWAARVRSPRQAAATT